jgi:FAD/FMN-containing dehydrogenase
MTDTPTTPVHARLDDDVVRDLNDRLRGALLLPHDDDYDAVRAVWNAAIDRRPAAIVRASDAADVIAAVHVARAHGLPIAVRSGGHNIAGDAACDGGLMLDLSLMKDVRVDAHRQTAHAAPGLTWGELDAAAQEAGLATIGVDVSTVGIGGVTLGGGFGWLVRSYGLACDTLRAVEIVTADGRLLTASADEHPDLFWAIRGGGGNFGVVTSFEYRLHPVGQLLAGVLLYPLDMASDVLRCYRAHTRSAPDELTLWAILLSGPDGTPLIALFVCYNGVGEAAETVVQPIRAFGPPLEDHVGPMAYRDLQTMFDAAFPAGQQGYWKSSFMHELSDEAIERLVERFASVPSPQSAVLIEHLEGAVGRVASDATAFAHRTVPYSFLIVSVWPDAADAERNTQWTDDLWQAVRSSSSDGVYVNYLGDEGQDRIRAAYGANYERLVALKNQYDPTNLFRVNQNVVPSDTANPNRTI